MRTTILIHYKRGLDRPVGYGLCFLAARALPIFCLRAMAKARGRYLSLGCPFSRCSAGLAAGGLLREVGCDGRPLRRWPQGVSLTRIACELLAVWRELFVVLRNVQEGVQGRILDV